MQLNSRPLPTRHPSGERVFEGFPRPPDNNVFLTTTKAEQLVRQPSFLRLVCFPLPSCYYSRLNPLRSAACRIRMSEASEDGGKDAQGNNLYAAVARTITRSAALYFSRPVRLFRPSKSMLFQLLDDTPKMIESNMRCLS